MLGHHRGSRRACSSAGVPPPDSDRQRDAARLKSSIARVKNSSVRGAVFGKTIRPSKRDAAAVHGSLASSSAASGRLHAVAAEAGVAFDQHGTSRPRAAPRRRGRAARPRCRRPRRAAGRARTSSISRSVLAAPTMLKVMSRSSVTPGVDEHFGLAELLAGQADGAGRDLHLADRRDLVGLDVRPVGPAARGDHGWTRAILFSSRSSRIVTEGVSRSAARSWARLGVVAGWGISHVPGRATTDGCGVLYFFRRYAVLYVGGA